MILDLADEAALREGHALIRGGELLGVGHQLHSGVEGGRLRHVPGLSQHRRRAPGSGQALRHTPACCRTCPRAEISVAAAPALPVPFGCRFNSKSLL